MVSASTQLERYRHISALGTGGMATVVLAEDTLLGRRVALKRMNAAGDARGLSRLRREALIGASVSHPNLVSIYDVLTSDDGEHVIVMEYVPGETLRDALVRETRLAPATALRILDGVAAGLDAIHRQGIIHRDVKPANILLGGDGTVKLADLGIASVPDRTRITTDGGLLGTFSYMAPEQLSGERATPATDVYALAAVAFEMLSGRKARTEPNPVALAHAISNQPPPNLRDAWPEAPTAAPEVLIRAMSRDPSARPPSATELTGRLRAALNPEPTAALAPRPARKAATPAAAAMAAGGAAAAAPARADDGGDRGDGARERQPADPPPRRYRSRSGSTAAGLLALALAGVVLAVLLNSGSSNRDSGAAGTHKATSGKRGHSAASSPATGNTGTSASSPAATPSGSATASTSSAPGAASTASASRAAGPSSSVGSRTTASTPTSAVSSFYTLAAAHRYAAAWALADPAFRNQLGGYQSFESGQSGDRSITFNSNRIVKMSGDSATVAVQTTSVRDNGTQHCSGTVDVVRNPAASGWLLHQIQINCV